MEGDTYVKSDRNKFGLPKDLKSVEKKSNTKKLSSAPYGAMSQSYVPDGDVLQELDLKKTGKKVLDGLKRGVKKIFTGPVIAPTMTKDQHLQKIRNSGGDPSHWANSFEPEGDLVEQSELERIQAAIKSGMMNGKKLTPEQIQGLKAGLTQGGNKVDEGTSYGLYKGDGKPKGPMAKFADAKKKKKETVKEDMKGMSQKSGDKRSTESGAGMTAKGVAKYNRRTGGNLKTAVTTPPSKLKPGSKAAKRRKSFCARSKSWDGPRGKAARRRWNCEYEPELPMIPEATRQKKEMGYDKGGTKKPTTPKRKDKALDMVLSGIRKKHGKGAIMRSGSNQQKKVRGAKSTAGTGKYKKMADDKRQLKKDAKEMGYGSNTKGYVETRARYGSKENMKKGRGLGT